MKSLNFFLILFFLVASCLGMNPGAPYHPSNQVTVDEALRRSEAAKRLQTQRQRPTGKLHPRARGMLAYQRSSSYQRDDRRVNDQDSFLSWGDRFLQWYINLSPFGCCGTDN